MAARANIDVERLLAHYRAMARIRAFEEAAERAHQEGHVKGAVHLSIGQEAVAAGVYIHLKREDLITTTHRGHGHTIAKGADTAAMLAELLGRASGTCQGKGGSLHIADFSIGMLGANGIDPSKDVTWLVFPAGELGLALDKGEVDAVADSEPIGSMLVAQGKVRTIADQAVDMPYADEYCCAVLVNGKFLARNLKASAAATRALLKAAKWVETNPKAAAKLSVEKKYLASTADQNTIAISHLRYVPSVSGARIAVRLAAAEMKTAGMLSPTTDVEGLAKRAFVSLDGVSDEWLNSLSVEKVAGGQVTRDWIRLQYAKFDPKDVFCASCLFPMNQ